MKVGNTTIAIVIRCLLCLNHDPEQWLPPSMLKRSGFRSFQTNVTLVENNTTITINKNIDKRICKSIGCRVSDGFTKTYLYRDTFVGTRLHASVLIITITSTFGILGNGIVLATYVSNYKEMTAFKFLICHLAASDLLFATTQIFQAALTLGKDQRFVTLQQGQNERTEGRKDLLRTIFGSHFGQKRKETKSRRINTYEWQFGKEACKFTRACYLSGSVVAIGTILLIAAERYQGVINPLRAGNIFHTKIKVGLALVWILTITTTVPVWIVAEVDDGVCTLDWVPSLGRTWMKGYHVFMLIVCCLIPAFILLVLYSRIIQRLSQSQETSEILSQQATQRRRQRNLGIVKILLAIIIFFYVSVLPLRVTDLLLAFINYTELSDAAFKAMVYCGIIYQFQVALNPLMYSFVNPKFRELVLRLFCRICRNNSHQK